MDTLTNLYHEGISKVGVYGAFESDSSHDRQPLKRHSPTVNHRSRGTHIHIQPKRSEYTV